MASNGRFGIVIFASDHRKLADFYAAVTGLSVQVADDSIVVLRSTEYELVIHKLVGEPAPTEPPGLRIDSYVKPFFPVTSLASVRERVATLGGHMEPQSKEWSARGFRACEAVDLEGNVIQFREDAP
jgi:predicted enzyme related to lactoylglutathione lyase